MKYRILAICLLATVCLCGCGSLSHQPISNSSQSVSDPHPHNTNSFADTTEDNHYDYGISSSTTNEITSAPSQTDDNTTTNISYTKDPSVLSFFEIDGKIVGIINGYDFTIVNGCLSIDVFDSESIGRIITKTGAFIDSLECVSLYPICGMPESEIENILILQPSLLYRSSNGIVFSKDGKTLALFPSGRTGSYTVPDGVTKIADGAFDHSKLSEVFLPASVTDVGTAFDKAPNIKIVREESK